MKLLFCFTTVLLQQSFADLLALNMNATLGEINVGVISPTTGKWTEVIDDRVEISAVPFLSISFDAVNEHVFVAAPDSFIFCYSLKNGSLVKRIDTSKIDGELTSIGYDYNSKLVYGVVAKCLPKGCQVSVVSVDLNSTAINTVLPPELLGSVIAAYYAWNMSHYAVITASPPTLTFYDTHAATVHLRNPIQQNVTVRGMAINYVTHNVFVLGVYGGQLRLLILHMTGLVQEVLEADLSRYRVDHVGPSCIDNSANIMYSILYTNATSACELVVFNLTSAGSIISLRPLLRTVDALTMHMLQ